MMAGPRAMIRPEVRRVGIALVPFLAVDAALRRRPESSPGSCWPPFRVRILETLGPLVGLPPRRLGAMKEELVAAQSFGARY